MFSDVDLQMDSSVLRDMKGCYKNRNPPKRGDSLISKNCLPWNQCLMSNKMPIAQNFSKLFHRCIHEDVLK